MMGFLKKSAPACLFHLTADDPERLVRQLRRRVETQAPSSGLGAERSPVANENR